MSGARPEMSYLHPARISPITLSVQAVLITYLDFESGMLRVIHLFSTQFRFSYRDILLNPGRAGPWVGPAGPGSGCRIGKGSSGRPAPSRPCPGRVRDGYYVRRDGPAPERQPGRRSRR